MDIQTVGYKAKEFEGSKKESILNSQTVGYKAKEFEGRNLALFFLIATGFPLLGYGFIQAGVVNIAEPGIGLSILMFIFSSAPTIAALVMTGITEGKSGFKALWKRFWNRDLKLKWLLLLLLFNPAERFIGNLISRAVGGEAYPWIEANFLPGLVFGLFVGLREEIGWRGYALPRLQARWGALPSSIIVGIFWALYDLSHWPSPYYWIFPVYVILLSIVFTWVFNNTNGSVLASVLLHATLAAGVVGCCGVSYPWAGVLLIGIRLVAVILIVIIFGPKNLVRQTSGTAAKLTVEK